MRQDARRRGNKITAMMYFRENYLGYSLRALCSEEASLRCMEAGRPSFLLPIVPACLQLFDWCYVIRIPSRSTLLAAVCLLHGF